MRLRRHLENRLHLDVTWVVFADPERNQFCILRALTPAELAADAGG